LRQPCYVWCIAVDMSIHDPALKKGRGDAHGPPSFLPLFTNVVERTFSWIDKNRRMSKDYERLCASGEALVYAAMSRLMLRRLSRA
jgi:hypothetical protein